MKDLGINPLEFDGLPYHWRQRALLAISTENSVESELLERSRRGT